MLQIELELEFIADMRNVGAALQEELLAWAELQRAYVALGGRSQVQVLIGCVGRERMLEER